MIIRKIAIGNSEEAYIESSFSEGVNVILSDDNNKGKTIVIQSILYAFGNKPIYPSSFNYKEYIYYLEFTHNDKEYTIVRSSDTFVVQSAEGINIFDGMAELKRYWTKNIFELPIILFNGNRKVVDMELFVQMFFVAQDGKDTSTIFNSGYYHKDDFKNMILSYAGMYSSEITPEEIKKLKDQIKTLKARRQEQIKLSDFYKEISPATEYLSRIKDKEAFDQKVSDMDAITEDISELRKKRNHLASKKSLWNGTLKELRSLNRNIEVGELRCMDCDSSNIAYKGKGKFTYSFDVSSPEMRANIISSIQEKIGDIEEEIKRYDFEIQELQSELNKLLNDDEITIENIVAYKSGFRNAEEIEEAVRNLDEEIKQCENELSLGVSLADNGNQERELFYQEFMKAMNAAKKRIDPESDNNYDGMFTKRGSVISGSEETVFYVSRLLAAVEMIEHECPIVMDSFRAEDLSTDKETRVLNELLSLHNQCILTTTLKAEEKGKYDTFEGIHVLDYTNHRTNKILGQEHLEAFRELLHALHISV